jgi:mRNA interferase HigB
MFAVQIIAQRTLRLFWEEHPQAEMPLRTWYAMVAGSAWEGPADAKQQFGASVDFIADNRLIFDIGGNKFRLVVHVAYRFKRVLVKFIGTHAEYDKIDPAIIRLR